MLAVHPFDTIVVRMSSGQAGGRSALACVKDLVAHEGILALYKGVIPPLLLTGSINSLLFGSQAMFVKAQMRPEQTSATLGQTMCAAVGSGFVASFGITSPPIWSQCCVTLQSPVVTSRPANAAVIAPMEGVKARLQVSTAPGGDRRLLPNLARIVRTLGLTRGLYRGAINRCVCAYGCVYACVNVCAHVACVLAMCRLSARRNGKFCEGHWSC